MAGGRHCGEEVCHHCLGKHPATGGVLSEGETELIHRHRRRLRFAAHRTICTAGRPPPFFIGNLIGGVVKLTFAGTASDVDALLFPGDFLGPFSDAGAVTCTAEALSECELCCFEGAGLHKIFARHPRLQENFLQHFADAVERARKDAARLRRPQAAARVAALLRIFAERGNGSGDGEREVHLPLKRSEIALLLGLSTETVSRRLSIMRHDGIIRPLSRERFVVTDMPLLRALAEN